MYVALGEACPPCSKLEKASCVICGPGDKHPSCMHCKDGVHSPPTAKRAWHETKVVESFVLPVTVSVLSAALIAYAVSR